MHAARSGFGVFALATLAACAGAGARGPAADPVGAGEPVTLTVLSTNDLHGAVDGVEVPELAGRGVRLGGFEYVAGLLASLKARDPQHALVVDAGDCFQGPLAVNLAEGMPCVRLLSAAGHAVATLGNHEFDYKDCGPDRLDVPSKDPQCALKRALREAPYPVVNANVRGPDGKTAPLGIRPYVVLDVGGVKVGVTGVLTTFAPKVSNPGGTAGLSFADPVASVREALPALRAEGAQVVIVLAHLSGQCGNGAEPTPDGLTACPAGEELGRLLDAFSPGEVDLVVAGHAHAYLAGGTRRVPVMETPGQGTFVGRARIAVAGGRPAAVEVLPPVPVCRVEDPESRACGPRSPGWVGVAPSDPSVRALAADLDASVAAVCQEVVARAGHDLLHPRRPETPLGNLTTDLMREAAAGPNAPPDVVALANLGGIRDSLREGPITACDLARVYPFDDVEVEVRLTGAELRRMLHLMAIETRKVPAVSGLTLQLGEGSLSVRDSLGRELDDGAWYRLVTVHYLVRGGDGMDAFFRTIPPDRMKVLPFPSHRDALRAMMKARGTLMPPALGRIVEGGR